MVSQRHHLDVRATVILLFVVTVATVASGCSSRPDIINCSLVEGQTVVESNGTLVNWMGTKPFGLRIMYLVKTSPAGESLTPISMIRWRIQLSRAHLKQPIHGFLIKVHDFEGEARTFEAQLEQPVQDVENNLTRVEFYLERDDVFKFGFSHKIEISLLPLGEYGSSSQIIQLPELPKEKTCIDDKKATDLAKYWIGKLDIFTLEELSAVNITMMTAPNFLCIGAYMIQITNRNGHVLYHKVVNKAGLYLSHVVEFLPRDVELIVKVTPSGDVCPCPACNCFISKSLPFVIPTMEEKVLPTKTLDFTYTEDESANLRKFVILTVVVLLLLLVFTLVFCGVRKFKGIYMRLPEHGGLQGYEGKTHRILLVASPSNKEEFNVIDEFALLLHNSKHTLFYERFDENSDVNIHKWLNKALNKADKIIMVHSIGHFTVEYFNCFNWIQDNTSTWNDKMIYVKLHEKAVIKNSFVETVFLLSRDCEIFCKQFGLQYSKQWNSLQDRCTRLYNKEAISVRIQDLQDAEAVALTSVPSPALPILVPQGTEDTVIYTSHSNDSGYADSS